MRLRLRSFLLTSALTFAPAVASATTISGLYVDGGAGYNEVQDQHVHANTPANGDAVSKFSVNHGTGYTGFGAIGYGFGNGLRVEAEGLYNNSEDNYTQNVDNNASNNGEQLQYLKKELQAAQTQLNDKLSGISTPSNPEYGQVHAYTSLNPSYNPGTPSTPGALPNVPDIEEPKYTIGKETYYTEKNSSTVIPESVDSLKNLSKELTQDQDAYNQVEEAPNNYDKYQSQVNTDVQEAQKASASYQQDQQKAETSYTNYQNQVASAKQAANDAYNQYQDTIQRLMQANPEYKTLIDQESQQATQTYTNYRNKLDQESQQVETSYTNYQDKLNKAIQSSTKNQDELNQDLQEAKNAYQQYQDQVKQFEQKYPNYQNQLTQDQSTVNGDITTVTPVENSVTNNNIIDVIPFNTQIPGSKNSPVQQAAEELNRINNTDIEDHGGYIWSGGTATASGCDSTYSWCGAFGGAPVVVIQKINELPQWAAPSTTGTTGINNPQIIIPELKNNGAYDIKWYPIENVQQWMYGLASPVADNDSTKMVSCTSCYYISTLTPDQAQQLYHLPSDKTSPWNGYDNDNGLLPGTPPLSQQTMNIPNTVGTGLNSGNNVPVEGAPFYCSDNQLCISTGGGTTYPNTFGGIYSGAGIYSGTTVYSGEDIYVQRLMEDLSNDGVLTKGFYYFQGNIEGPNANGNIFQGNVGGQVYKDYPNQQGYDNEVNNVGSNTYYPNVNVNNPGYGYPEPTPLPTCTNGSCTLNIGSTWYQSNTIWPEKYGGTQQGIGVVSTIPNFSGYGPFNYQSGSTGHFSIPPTALMQISTPDTARRAARDHQIDFFAMRTVTSHRVPVSNLVTNPNIGTPMLVSYHGRDQSYGGFANVLYDFDLERLFGLRSIVTPFVGGGAGYLWQRYDSTGPVAAAAITGVHGGFAWQGIAGVAFDTGIRGLQITAQYRMIGQPGSFYNGAFNYGTEGGHANFDQRFNHQFIVGFRYAFQNQPIHHIQPPAVRPIVAAAPAPVPARSYLVFFDWNQYALTSRARQIVVEAAHATSYVHTTRINVNGYTDSSAAPGPAGQKYNYALSVKRAKSVEAELIRNGVPLSEIVIRGYGDANPLVPTAPNTRKPQNRRVEIILHA